jgi:NAD(P)-dependent dehydrogenase (short-subunit alcohol dehydrogenase family)
MALQGRVVVVTGGAMGIGRYIAHGFARAGAHCAIADVADEDLASVARELDAMGTQQLCGHVDVRDETAVRDFMARVADRFGRIDVLVNDAAIVPHFQWGGPRWPALRDLDAAFWSRVIDTNLGGTFLCTKYVLPYMEHQREGHVITLHGGGRGTGACAYVVSKDAIRTFTRFAAEEEREHGVCVVCLSPGGAIATEKAPEEARRRMPGPDLAGDRFLLAAEAPMSLSGELLDLQDGRLVPIAWT